jgi:heme/copper-type cytochrome/quinol oxidase subunit 3
MPYRRAVAHDIVGRPGRWTMRVFIVSALILVSSLFLAFVLSGSTADSGSLEGANLFAFLALCAFWVAFWSGVGWLITTADPHSRI